MGRARYAGSELSRKGASARQLSSLEEHNPRLLSNTDDLWRLLCQTRIGGAAAARRWALEGHVLEASRGAGVAPQQYEGKN